ncbi:hypothetical protein E0Z10_g9596 [Xylaria hypoxylon]|uniref:Uncharacterized protein n=1 Tax=Xylaria hypoxylon TaxID=37992 RepID=A0A4Z0Y513_9PEZI|nr:hypothetical protein E0Z10_g9596 [Xylaria hypoxylon]
MSFHASTNAQRFDHGLWCALTRLDGFEFPQESPLTGRELKDFEKAMIGKSSWRHLTQDDLAVRVTAIFKAASYVYETTNDPVPNNSFYVSVAKKVGKSKLKFSQDNNTFRQVIDTYVDGLKTVATRAESHVYVDRRSAPAALSVASWIELTEDRIITITTRKPTKAHNGISPQQQLRKKRAEVLEGGSNNREGEARKIQLKNAIGERDQAAREFEKAKIQIHSLTQEIESTKFKCDNQKVQLQDARREAKRKTSELKRAETKQDKFLRALKASQREREEAIVNVKRQYDDRDSEYVASVEAQWRNAIRELTLAKQERDQYQRTLADCAGVIKSLNSRLNGESSGD